MVKRGARVAAAVGIGYLLGRRRKLQLALTLGAAAVAGRLTANSGELLRHGTRSLLSSPDLDKLVGLGRPLRAAARAAAVTAVTSRIDAVSDRLQDRAETLRRGGTGRPDPRSRSTADADEYHDGDRYDDEDEPAAPRTRRPSDRLRTEDAADDHDDDRHEHDRYRDEFDDSDEDAGDEFDEDDDEPASPPSRDATGATGAVVRRRRR